MDFPGPLNTGPYPVAVARNAANTPGTAEAGYHLVGNPYSAPLDCPRVAPANRAGLDAAMYVFESSSPYGGAYRTYINTFGSSLIGSGQGFFVRVSTGNTAGTLTSRDAQRLTDFAAQVLVRRGANDPRPQLRLTLAGPAGPADAMVLYTEADAMAGLDPAFDAPKLTNLSGLNLAPTAALVTGRASLAAQVQLYPNLARDPHALCPAIHAAPGAVARGADPLRGRGRARRDARGMGRGR